MNPIIPTSAEQELAYQQSVLLEQQNILLEHQRLLAAQQNEVMSAVGAQQQQLLQQQQQHQLQQQPVSGRAAPLVEGTPVVVVMGSQPTGTESAMTSAPVPGIPPQFPAGPAPIVTAQQLQQLQPFGAPQPSGMLVQNPSPLQTQPQFMVPGVVGQPNPGMTVSESADGAPMMQTVTDSAGGGGGGNLAGPFGGLVGGAQTEKVPQMGSGGGGRGQQNPGSDGRPQPPQQQQNTVEPTKAPPGPDHKSADIKGPKQTGSLAPNVPKSDAGGGGGRTGGAAGPSQVEGPTPASAGHDGPGVASHGTGSASGGTAKQVGAGNGSQAASASADAKSKTAGASVDQSGGKTAGAAGTVAVEVKKPGAVSQAGGGLGRQASGNPSGSAGSVSGEKAAANSNSNSSSAGAPGGPSTSRPVDKPSAANSSGSDGGQAASSRGNEASGGDALERSQDRTGMGGSGKTDVGRVPAEHELPGKTMEADGPAPMDLD